MSTFACHRARGRRLLLAVSSLLVLSACGGLPTLQPAVDEPTAAMPAPSEIRELAPQPEMPAPATLSVAPDVWQRFASGRHWKTCELNPGVQRWIGRYAGKPERFAATLAPVVPLMDYVLNEALARDLPSEVMLVPIIESYYRADARGPAGALGLWQLMPDTGRRFGLVGRGSSDDRLDVIAATAAAMRLLELNGDAFSDNPKLMFAAYNAGAYRLRKALGGRDHASMRSLDGLGLSRTTREYIDKIKALGCLIGEPQRFALQLPPLPQGARLVEYRAPHPVDPNALAARAGMPAAELRKWNQRAFARSASDAAAPMLLPARMIDSVDAAIAAGELPKVTPRQPPTAVAGAVAKGRVHRVSSGDSLWTISKRYRVRLADLMRWNGLNQRSVLRIGQTLVLQGNS